MTSEGLCAQWQISEVRVGVHLSMTPKRICARTICYIIKLTHSSSCTKWTSFCRISSSTLRRQKQEGKHSSSASSPQTICTQLLPPPAQSIPALDVEVLPQHQVFEGGMPGERWDDSQQVSIQTYTHTHKQKTTHIIGVRAQHQQWYAQWSLCENSFKVDL